MNNRRPHQMSPVQQMPPQPPQSNRQNEYFLPRDGIDREVITADICRYLGNDALVRPGTYENPETRQILQGYYITAYRNLTSAMIDDLKADSARWDQERRMQGAQSRTGQGYQSSKTHAMRNQSGPSGSRYQQEYDYDGYNQAPLRYPGSTAPGYSGSSNAVPAPSSYGQNVSGQGYPQDRAQAYPQGNGPSFPQANNQGGYPSRYPGNAPQYSQPDPGYDTMAMDSYGNAAREAPYVDVGADFRSRPAEPPRGFPDHRTYPNGPGRPAVLTTGAAAPPSYATAPAPQPSGYPQSGSYYPPVGGMNKAGYHPQDMLYGRGPANPERTQSPPSAMVVDQYPAAAPPPKAPKNASPYIPTPAYVDDVKMEDTDSPMQDVRSISHATSSRTEHRADHSRDHRISATTTGSGSSNTRRAEKEPSSRHHGEREREQRERERERERDRIDRDRADRSHKYGRR